MFIVPEVWQGGLIAFYLGSQLILLGKVFSLATRLASVSTELAAHITKWDGDENGS